MPRAERGIRNGDRKLMNENNINNVDGYKREKLNNIPVFSGRLAFKLIELGYFYDLVGMANNRTKPGQKVYYFTRTEELEKIIDDYKIDRQIIKDALSEMED